MTTKTCAKYHELSGTFSTKPEIAAFTYDFANDTGESDHTAYYLGKFLKKSIILGSWVHVETAATSDGSATVKIGTAGGATADDDCFLDATSGAVASLTKDAVVYESAGQGIVVNKDDTINMVIGTADLKTGKITLYVEYMHCA